MFNNGGGGVEGVAYSDLKEGWNTRAHVSCKWKRTKKKQRKGTEIRQKKKKGGGRKVRQIWPGQGRRRNAQKGPREKSVQGFGHDKWTKCWTANGKSGWKTGCYVLRGNEGKWGGKSTHSGGGPREETLTRGKKVDRSKVSFGVVAVTDSSISHTG